MKWWEAETMTVTNELEVLAVLGVLYIPYCFYRKRG
jgi:hypothetical protein